MRGMCLGLFAMLWVSSAWACSNYPRVSFHEAVDRAATIFIFRLESAHAAAPGPNVLLDSDYIPILGRIRLIEVVKGRTPQFETISFNAGLCAGIRLDVGHLYAAATNQSGHELQVEPDSHSILDVTAEFSAIKALRAHAAGKKLPTYIDDDAMDVYMSPLMPPSSPPYR